MAFRDTPIRFGVFEVRVDTRELRKQGVRIKLEEQPFSVLLALLETPGSIVTRNELRARLWPDGTFVDFDKSLTKAVNKVRTALDDSAATPRYIETLSRRGYRFIAPVSTCPTGAPPEAVEAPAAARDRFRRWWMTAAACAGALLVLVLNVGGVRDRLAGLRSVPLIQSLAVLPVVNLTGDASQEYLADSLTDDLIGDLARIGTLRVISYTSAMHFKGARTALPEIARELKVDGVIEGSVQQAGGRIRINFKLVRAAGERQEWSESYEGKAAEARQIAGQVVLAVAHRMSAQVTAEAGSLLPGAQARPAAWESYRRGRYLWNLRGKEAVTQAATYFEQAVRVDPGFALAWSGLADSYTIDWGAMYDPALGLTYARKAATLDPGLAEAHVSLGWAEACNFRFAEAGKELQRGVELGPNYVPGHQLYALYLMTVGRLSDALAENDRALQLDPFSLPVNNLRTIILTNRREYGRAEQQALLTSRIDPQKANPIRHLARLYWIQGRTAQAQAAERKLATWPSDSDGDIPPEGFAGGDEASREFGHVAALLRSVRLKDRARPGSGTWMIATQFGLLQDRKMTLEHLEQAAARRYYGTLCLLKTAPEFDFLRSDPGYQDLLRRIGLPAAEVSGGRAAGR